MNIIMNSLPTAMVLFCGVGGSSLGLLWAGFKELLSIDNWHVAQRNFELNFRDGKYGHIPFLNADIMKLSAEEIMTKALIYAGELALLVITAPCQGFSIASGKANPLDPRNALFLKGIEIAAAIRPKIILFENVPGMLRPEMTPIMNEIKLRFKEQLSEYYIFCFQVNALFFGAPTDRERLIYLCIRKDIFKFSPLFLAATPNIGRFTIGKIAPAIRQIHFGQSKRIIRTPREFMCTITATEGVYYFENDVWTPLAENESYLKRFSSFPEDFELDASTALKCKLIGNGVPPMLMYHLAVYIRTEILGYPPVNALPMPTNIEDPTKKQKAGILYSANT